VVDAGERGAVKRSAAIKFRVYSWYKSGPGGCAGCGVENSPPWDGVDRKYEIPKDERTKVEVLSEGRRVGPMH